MAEQEGLGQFVGHAHSSQFVERVTAVGSLGVNHGHGLGQFVAHGVVIGDDDIEAQLVSVGYLVPRANATVHGDDDVCTVVGQLGQRLLVQAVPLVHAVGDVGAHVAAQRPHGLYEERRSGNAVGVKVAVHDDRLTGAQCPPQAGDGGAHPRQDKGVGLAALAVEKGRYLNRVGETTIVEHLHGDGAQVGETGDVAG